MSVWVWCATSRWLSKLLSIELIADTVALPEEPEQSATVGSSCTTPDALCSVHSKSAASSPAMAPMLAQLSRICPSCVTCSSQSPIS